jgi:hypothetical protein
LLFVGNRAQLASQIEQSLLQAGVLVLRTRVPMAPSLATMARLGAVVLLESDDSSPITLAAVHGSDTAPHELVFDQPDEILSEIQRLGAIPNGEDQNDDGLGI